MNTEARRHLEVLEAVAENERITQRSLASKVGIAVGLANLYLKRLVRKGYIKCVSVQSNRILYLLTPQGVAEKTRLTYEFMDYSLDLYRQARRHLREVLCPYALAGHKAIGIYGVGEAAELAYLSLKESGLEPAVIFDGQGGQEFLGMPVRELQTDLGGCDVLIVATLEDPRSKIADLVRHGIPRERLVTLRPLTDERA